MARTSNTSPPGTGGTLPTVPGDERVRAAERCSVHGSTPSIATCDGCGRPLCLSCAIPVRGRTLGAECLSEALGPDAAVPETPAPAPGRAHRRVAAVAFALALVSTAVPWSRFGAGAGPFGAWRAELAWSLLAALAAAAGLAVTVGGQVGGGARRWDGLGTLAGALVIAGAVLAIDRPPAFTSPWLGPWVALAFGAVATGTSFAALRSTREPEPPGI